MCLSHPTEVKGATWRLTATPGSALTGVSSWTCVWVEGAPGSERPQVGSQTLASRVHPRARPLLTSKACSIGNARAVHPFLE